MTAAPDTAASAGASDPAASGGAASDVGRQAPEPSRLPRLLPVAGRTAALDEHLAAHGPLPARTVQRLLAEVETSGLTGRGGAGFPVARKLAAVTERAGLRGSVVIGNGSEGEPASAKDKTLLALAPHLVLDGLQVAATAARARSVWLYLPDDAVVAGSVRRALEQRRRRGIDRIRVRVATAPRRFLAGEESAVVSALAGDTGLPTSTPPRVFERGLGGRPTLVQNVETLAHLALVARWGGEWYRSAGAAGQPGTRLFTVWDRGRHTVLEGVTGTTARQLYDALGVDVSAAQALLVGGYHGAWLEAPKALDLALTDPVLRPLGASAGAGVVAALPPGVCGVVETARVASYLAEQSARQCGPCLNGLPLIADALRTLARPTRAAGVRERVERWAGLVEGRGACRHPDGTVRLVRSGLSVFSAELDRHARGSCSASEPAFLPLAERGGFGAAR